MQIDIDWSLPHYVWYFADGPRQAYFFLERGLTLPKQPEKGFRFGSLTPFVGNGSRIVLSLNGSSLLDKVFCGYFFTIMK